MGWHAECIYYIHKANETRQPLTQRSNQMTKTRRAGILAMLKDLETPAKLISIYRAGSPEDLNRLAEIARLKSLLA